MLWESFDLGPEDILWTGINFMGGFSGQQEAPCGALSAAVVSLGLLHRAPLADKKRTKQARQRARQDADELVRGFKADFGNISCRQLVGFDFSQPGEYQRFQESGRWNDTCNRFVQFVIERFYGFADKRDIPPEAKKVIIYTKPACRFCDEAKRDLAERGIPYEEISIEDNPEAEKEWLRLAGANKIVPVIVMDGEVKVDFGGG
ncbi:MAG: C-GCAxxG-C-C family protein [Deltaproteobacteria bacterium]|nr:C-GCAxxG-C-C family protein [Deltaproteobacteria bacterium]